MAGENAHLAQHMKNCQEYEMAGRQNQLTLLSNVFVSKSLFIIRKFLVQSIVNEIDICGGQFGIMMDGSQDVSFQEQISLVARYVDQTNKVVERTIAFFSTKKTSGKCLYELLLTKLREIGLKASNIVGCSFDGASNMTSDVIGVISYIQTNDNPNCFFSWCLSHRFNLCITWALKESIKIKEMLLLAEESAKIFRGSYKRMNVWVEVAKTTPNFNSKKRLKLIGKTRWSSKEEAVKSIIENESNFYVLIKALLNVCSLDNLEGAALINASNNLNAWLRYDNVVVIFITHKIFSSVTATTKSLQKMGLTILEGVGLLKTCKQQLEKSKNLLQDYIEQADQFVQNVNALLNNDEEIKSLDCDCYISLPTEDEKQKKINRITNSFHDFIERLQHEIDERILSQFDDSESIHHEILYLNPQSTVETFLTDENCVSLRKLCEINKISDENAAKDELKKFNSEFIQYLNRSELVSVLNDNNDLQNGSADEEELTLLIESESDAEETLADLKSVRVHSMNKNKCSCFECILEYISSKEDRLTKYGHIFKLYKYVATLPSTQVKCERDFSKLKLTKNRLRSSLGEKSLENLMLISAESKMFKKINLNNVIDEIIASSTRLSLFANL